MRLKELPGLEGRLSELLESFDEALQDGRSTTSIDGEVEALGVDAVSWFREASDQIRAIHGVQARTVFAEQKDILTPSIDRSTMSGKFGRFEIRRLLGSGGGGVVYRAFDPKLGREIALKLPRPDAVLNDDLVRRFAREGQAAARLDHPNIVRVYEAGDVGLIAYIASEYCDGPTLAEWLKERRVTNEPVPVEFGARIVERLADAMSHAHHVGVLHRDIKPSNVLLEPISKERKNVADALPFTPRIADFGLAKLMGGTTDETKTGTVLGTVNYMAPEQAVGKTKEIGAPADVYSLGAMLYELLAGRTPFVGETDHSTFNQVIHDEPLALRRLRKSVPADLETICHKCLQKNPADRYPTAKELADDLDRFLSDRPIVARPTSLFKRTLLWTKRRPALASLIFVCILAATLGAWGGFIYQRHLRSALELAKKHAEETIEQNARLREHQYALNVRIAGEEWEAGRIKLARSSLERASPSPGEKDLRSFDWRLVHRRCYEGIELVAHEGDVYHAEFSPDGRLLATSGKDKIIRIWNVADWKEIRTLRGHSGEVNWASFSPDSKRVVSASDDHTVAVWNVSTGKQEFVCQSHARAAVAAIFSPDGSRIISGGCDSKLRTWSAMDGRQESELRLECGEVQCLALNPRSLGPELAVVGTFNSGVLVYDLSRLSKRPDALNTGLSSAICVAYSPDGRALCIGANDVAIIDPRKKNAPRSSSISDSGPIRIEGMAVDPSSTEFAVGSGDSIIRIGDLQKTGPVRKLRGHTAGIWSVCYSPDGKQLVSTSRDGVIRVWNPRRNQVYEDVTPSEMKQTSSETGGIPITTFDGNHFYISGSRGVFRVDAKDGSASLVAPIDRRSRPYHFCVAGRRPVVAVPREGVPAIDVWNLDSGREALTLDYSDLPPENRNIDARPMLSAMGTILAAKTGKQRITVWTLPEGRRVGCYPIDSAVGNIGVDSTADDSEVHISAPTQRYLLDRTHGTLSPISLSAESLASFHCARGEKLLQIGVQPGVIELARREEPMTPFVRISMDGIRTYACSADGRTVAVGRVNGDIHLWSVESGEQTVVLKGHRQSVSHLAFSPDDSVLASWSTAQEGYSELFFWHADPISPNTLP